MSTGSLLRMFDSEYFSLPMALVHLERHDHAGVQTYLVNKLYSYPPEAVAFYLPQLVTLALKRADLDGLGTYLLDMASKSYLFAMNLYWHLHSKLDSKQYSDGVEGLLHDCEMTLVNGIRPQRSKVSEPPAPMFAIPGLEDLQGEDYAYTYKQYRNDYFLLQSKLLFALTGISIALIDQLAESRDDYLKRSLQTVNQIIDDTRDRHSDQSPYIKRLFRGVVLPSTFCEDPDYSIMQVVRIPYEYAVCYKTKSRVPYKVYLEMVAIEEELVETESVLAGLAPSEYTDTAVVPEYAGTAEVVPEYTDTAVVPEYTGTAEVVSDYTDTAVVPDYNDTAEVVPNPTSTETPADDHSQQQIDTKPPSETTPTHSEPQVKTDELKPAPAEVDPVLETDPALKGRRVEQIEDMRFEGLTEFAEKVEKAEKEGGEVSVIDSAESVSFQTDAQVDQWSTVAANIRAVSRFGELKSWKLRAFIVKGQDDLRQELLAMQFIKKAREILTAAGICAYLRPYEIYVVADNAGLIEFVPDSQSLSSIHKRHRTLLEFYAHTWEGSFLEAQKCFTESMAGYSLICYLLNIKDRHNGNILIDSFGHIIHIDFGFFLTSSPGGNINFETAPFKMTKEMLELMTVDGGEMLQYFKVLLFKGLLELRKHKEELILLVQMMMSAEPLGCFVKEKEVLRELDERFHLSKTDAQCYQLIEDLLSQASLNWRTVKYDSFQRYSNGIL